MKRTVSTTRNIVFLLGVISNAVIGCKKEIQPSHGAVNANVSFLDSVLFHSPFTLFYAAIKRSGADARYGGIAEYTYFVPTDSAMAAAGLDVGAIQRMSRDSLFNIVTYHIGEGSLNGLALSGVQGNIADSSEQRVSYFNVLTGLTTVQNTLYLDFKNTLSINGLSVNHGETPLQTANGKIYPIDKVLFSPSRTLFNILKSRKELSLFLAAIRINESLSNLTAVPGFVSDSALLSSFSNFQANPISGGISQVTDPEVTLFAPTNQAFVDAGFPDSLSILNYALSNSFNGIPFLPTDILIKYQEIIYQMPLPSQGIIIYRPIFINDILEIKGINSGEYGATALTLDDPSLQYPLIDSLFSLHYRTVGNAVFVNWRSGNSALTSSAMVIDSAKNILAVNGILHEVNQLFYPPYGKN